MVKPLLPTLKEKKRYIAYKIHSEQLLAEYAGKQLGSELSKILGVFDSAEAGLMPIVYEDKTQTGVLRTSLKALAKVRAAMMLVSSVGKEKVMIQPLLTSGILKKAKQAM